MSVPATIRGAILASAALLLSVGLGGCPAKKPKTPACSSDKDCKDGLVCIDKTCQAKKSSECDSDDDCKDGKVCDAGACVACASDAQCGPGGRCEAGACQRAKKCAADTDCADDEDCLDGFCQRPWLGGKPDGVCALETVYFAFDDSSVAEAERERLAKNAGCLDQQQGKNTYLYGHTDQAGTEEYNVALSERRGRAVADYLARLGIDPARLQVVPKGETQLTGQGDDKDRRVEFQWR